MVQGDGNFDTALDERGRLMNKMGIAFDVITDHDLDEKGVELLSSYKVVLTGSHPEYHTEGTLDALQAYTENGGRLMYLGGNGYYWVTGTRKDELLLSADEFAIVHKLRRVLSGLDSHQAIDLLMSQLRKTKNNYEFLVQVSKTAPGAPDGTD